MADLTALLARFRADMAASQLAMNGLSFAPEDREDPDISANAMFEGIFLRAFTSFENCLEELFLHYCSGGVALGGFTPNSRLSNCTEGDVRAILKMNARFIDWSSPQTVRDRSDLFLRDGEPIRSGIDARSHILTDIEKLRNMIAHDSVEAANAYVEVQRNVFLTERLFKMTPGQLLRTRRRHRPLMSWCAYYLSVMSDAIEGIANKS